MNKSRIVSPQHMLNFISLFRKGGWIARAQKFLQDRSKLAALAMQASYYVRRKHSLQEVKDDVNLLGRYVQDIARGRYRGFKKRNLLIIVAVLIYVVSPLDIIPDFIPGGLIDDISIVGWAVKVFSAEMAAYRRACQQRDTASTAEPRPTPSAEPQPSSATNPHA